MLSPVNITVTGPKRRLFVSLFFHYLPLERSLIHYVTESRSFGGHFKPNSDVTQTAMCWEQSACRQIKERVH